MRPLPAHYCTVIYKVNNSKSSFETWAVTAVCFYTGLLWAVCLTILVALLLTRVETGGDRSCPNGTFQAKQCVWPFTTRYLYHTIVVNSSWPVEWRYRDISGDFLITMSAIYTTPRRAEYWLKTTPHASTSKHTCDFRVDFGNDKWYCVHSKCRELLDPPWWRHFFHTKANSSNCSLFKWAVTAVCLCTAYLPTLHCLPIVALTQY